jgi:hypothetical protein
LKEIMSVVERSSVTLKEYCLHAVYRPHDLGEWDGDEYGYQSEFCIPPFSSLQMQNQI